MPAQKNIKATFDFSEFVSACKKPTQFINSFLRYKKGTPIFDHVNPKNY